MNVIQIVTHFDLGGAERIAINIAKSKQSNINYHMIEVIKGASSFSKEYINEMKEAGIHYYTSPYTSSKIGIIMFPVRLYKLIKSLNPVAIHTHTEIPDISLYWSYILHPSLFKNIRLIRTIHNTQLWNKWKKIGHRVEAFMQKHKANISTSQMITEAYQSEFGPDKNIQLIYNGFSETQQTEYPHLEKNKINILFAGRFVKQKGISTLINVIKQVKNQNLIFHIAGKGEFQDLLLQELGSKKNVKITPPIFGLAKYLASFDYVFIPSEHEGLNSLSIESSINKTLVIINNIDGLNETLPNDYILKINNNSIQEYTELFDNAICNIKREELIKKTFNYAQTHFNMRKMQEEYEKLYLNMRF